MNVEAQPKLTEEETRMATLSEKTLAWLQYGKLAACQLDRRLEKGFRMRQLVLVSRFGIEEIAKLTDFLCWRQETRHQNLPKSIIKNSMPINYDY